MPQNVHPIACVACAFVGFFGGTLYKPNVPIDSGNTEPTFSDVDRDALMEQLEQSRKSEILTMGKVAALQKEILRNEGNVKALNKLEGERDLLQHEVKRLSEKANRHQQELQLADEQSKQRAVVKQPKTKLGRWSWRLQKTFGVLLAFGLLGSHIVVSVLLGSMKFSDPSESDILQAMWNALKPFFQDPVEFVSNAFVRSFSGPWKLAATALRVRTLMCFTMDLPVVGSAMRAAVSMFDIDDGVDALLDHPFIGCSGYVSDVAELVAGIFQEALTAVWLVVGFLVPLPPADFAWIVRIFVDFMFSMIFAYVLEEFAERLEKRGTEVVAKTAVQGATAMKQQALQGAKKISGKFEPQTPVREGRGNAAEVDLVTPPDSRYSAQSRASTPGPKRSKTAPASFPTAHSPTSS